MTENDAPDWRIYERVVAAFEVEAADSDEAGHAFQFEAGHPFRFEAGHGSDLKSATWRRSPRVEGMMFSFLVLVKHSERPSR